MELCWDICVSDTANTLSVLNVKILLKSYYHTVLSYTLLTDEQGRRY